MVHYTYSYKEHGFTRYATKTSHKSKSSAGHRKKSKTRIAEQMTVSLLKVWLKPKPKGRR